MANRDAVRDELRAAVRLPENEYAALRREAVLRGVSVPALFLLMFRVAAAEFFS